MMMIPSLVDAGHLSDFRKHNMHDAGIVHQTQAN